MQERLSWLAFGIALLLYIWTLQPGLSWGDGVRLQHEAITAESFVLAEILDVEWPPDAAPFARLGVAAWDHPLYVIIGHTLVQSLPGVSALWLVNLVSAVFGAATVGLLWAWLYRETGAAFGAALGAGALAVSHTFWWHSTTPEVYTLFTALLLAALLFERAWAQTGSRWAAFGYGVSVGLGLANHLLAGIGLAVVGAVVLLTEPRGSDRRLPTRVRALLPVVALAAAGVALGAAPYWIQFARMVRLFSLGFVLGPATGVTFFSGSLAQTPADLAQGIGAYLTFLVYQFGPHGVALGALGWWHGRRLAPRLWLRAVTLYAAYLLFGVVYQVSDQFAFFQGAHLFWAAAIGLGATWLDHALGGGRAWLRPAALASLLVMPAIYQVAPRLLPAAGVTEASFGIPAIGTGARDGLDFYLNPNKRGDRSAETFGRVTLAALPADAVVLAHWYPDTDEYFVLRYLQQVEGLRPDVTLVGWATADPFAFDPALARAAVATAGERPVYLASLDEAYYGVDALSADYEIVSADGLYRLLPRSP